MGVSRLTTGKTGLGEFDWISTNPVLNQQRNVQSIDRQSSATIFLHFTVGTFPRSPLLFLQFHSVLVSTTIENVTIEPLTSR
ncbi:3-hydroxyacyl-[acyl-carrier-protein] dehydratase FabZ [Trichinella spiralis]|uniref:3-hydroxyacyl-[acyl-carrier-protein] dehydratase FabZ n=2 Tax=Trichinella spiralis TaxID=6334 RepID=A0ABR3KGS8_TRISP